MKIILVLLLIFSTQVTFGQKKTNSSCSDCKTLAQPISIPKPEYPKEAKDSGLKGTVKVQVSIDEKGNVTEAKLIEGNRIFEMNAIKAAMLAKFKPAKYIGTERAAKNFGVLVFNFVTEEENAEDLLGSPINLPKPPFPSFSGKVGSKKPQVFVQIEIDENGNVISAKGIAGHPVLRAACETAARNSKFSQTKIKGVPVKAKAILLYEFNLEDDSKKVELKSIEPIKK